MTQSNNAGTNEALRHDYAVAEAGIEVVGTKGIVAESSSYTPNANSIVVGSSTISHLPDEELYGIRKMEFQLLLDGDVSGARGGRDLCLGFLISGIIGFLGLVATVDWNEVFTKNHRAPAGWAGVMFAIVAASAVGATICEIKRRRTKQDSAYSSLIERLRSHFGIQSK